MPGSDLLEPRNNGDVHVELGIQFLSSTGYSYLFSAHDLCGTRNTWLCLFLLGPSSSETATLKTSHVVPCIGLETPRSSRGELLRWVPRLQLRLGWTQAVPDVTSSLWRSISVFPVPPRRTVSVSSSSGASVLFFSSFLFSFCAEELPCLGIRASLPLMYFSNLASTSAMLA